MGYYNYATICENGHVVSSMQRNYQPHCEKCGAKTTSFCMNCNKPIHGRYEFEDAFEIGFEYEKPYYCWNCGKPYPWTEKILNNAVEILSLDDGLSEADKELIITAIPDLIAVTPDTAVAATKFRKIMEKAAEPVVNGLKQLLTGIVVEVAKGILF